MSGWSYEPQIWQEKRQKRRLYDTNEYDFLKKRARECILWHMTPSDWDALTDIEYLAFHEAWADLNSEKGN